MKNSAKIKDQSREKKFILKNNFENPYLFFMTISNKSHLKDISSHSIPKLQVSSNSQIKSNNETLTSRVKKTPISEFISKKMTGKSINQPSHGKSNSLNPASFVSSIATVKPHKKSKGASEAFADRKFIHSEYFPNPLSPSTASAKTFTMKNTNNSNVSNASRDSLMNKDKIPLKHGSTPNFIATLKSDEKLNSWRIGNLKKKSNEILKPKIDKLYNNFSSSPQKFEHSKSISTQPKITKSSNLNSPIANFEPNPQSPTTHTQPSFFGSPTFESIFHIDKGNSSDLSEFQTIIKESPVFLTKVISKRNKLYFFGLANGHGPNGNLISTMILETISDLIAKDSDLYENTEKAIGRSIYFGNKKLARSSIDTSLSGASIIILVFFNGLLFTGIVGDLQASVYEEVDKSFQELKLCFGHKLEMIEEQQRIELMGGTLEVRGDGVIRVWLGKEAFPGLKQSRTIGDLIASQIGIISDPEITEYEIIKSTRFVIICTSNFSEEIPKAKVSF